MERHNGIEPDQEGAFVLYADAQRALDAAQDDTTKWFSAARLQREENVTIKAQLEAVRKERDAAVALTDQAIHLGNDALANLQDEYATLQADPVALRTVLEQINVLDANVRTHEQTNSALGYRKALQDVRNAIGTMYALQSAAVDAQGD